MKDALGNKIELNSCYGYSRNQNGFTYVRIGNIVKINEKSVTMEVLISKRALYAQELEKEECASKISIKANMLFPIGKYSESQMRKAYITGIEHQEQRCGYFDINDY